MESKKDFYRSWLVVVHFLILIITTLVIASSARAVGVRGKQSPQSEKNNVQNSQNNTPEDTAQASRERSGSDEAQFKDSASMKWMARKLGVSTATAYGLSVALNFITMVVLVVLPLRSRLPALFRNRTQLIRQGLDEARRASAEARERLSAIESRLTQLQSEIARIQTIADRESQVEQERILAAAEKEKAKIVEAAGREITAAVSRANLDFRTYAAELAVTLAASGTQVDASTDEGLLRSFIDQLRPNGCN